MKTQVKTGRKQKHHIDSRTGLPVLGLSCRPSDGRWRIIGTQRTFTEQDEQRAIERFRRMTNPNIVGSVGVRGLPVNISHERAEQIAAKMEISKEELIDLLTSDEAWYWERVAKDIRERPQYVAMMTGDERIGYLDKIKPPQPILSPHELVEFYKSKAKVAVANMP